MELSDEGRKVLKRFEAGPKFNSLPALIAYRDIAGVWTIGWGHTKGVYAGATCTLAQAEQWLTEDTAWAADTVRNYVRVPVSQGEVDAMILLCFNIGAAAFRGSTVLKLVNLGEFEEAADHFAAWDKAHVNGVLVEVQGLKDRRLAERELFLGVA
jgi:lysozyme